MPTTLEKERQLQGEIAPRVEHDLPGDRQARLGAALEMKRHEEIVEQLAGIGAAIVTDLHHHEVLHPPRLHPHPTSETHPLEGVLENVAEGARQATGVQEQRRHLGRQPLEQTHPAADELLPCLP